MTVSALTLAVIAHVMPTGHFERGIQVTVLPSVIRVVYQIAASDETFQTWMQNHNCDRIGQLNKTIDSGLQFEVDGRKKPLRFVNVSVEDRHHPKAVFTFESTVKPSASPSTLSLQDGNLADAPGSIRMAIIGRDHINIVRSNARGTLVRAERKSLGGTSEQERRDACRLIAEFRLEQSKQEDLVFYAIGIAIATLIAFSVFRTINTSREV